MTMEFLGLLLVTAWVVFFLHFTLGSIVAIFYRKFAGSDLLKIIFK
jgi:hypothetical protein